jgi:hypothetical protein
VVYRNDMGLPGSGGVITIGAHRTTASVNAPFQFLDQVNADTTAKVTTIGPDGTVMTGWGVFTYKAAVCDDQGNYVCHIDVSQMLPSFAANQSSVETLFLFSCDGGNDRIFAKLELASVAPPPTG